MSLKDYLPGYYREIPEMMSVLEAEDRALAEAAQAIEEFPRENGVLTCSDEGVELWESFLGLDPKGTLTQRKMAIIAILRGQGQLNEEKIKSIVNAFTGTENSALVEVVDGELQVRVLPPEWGEIYDFGEISRALSPRIPAHVGLKVERFYHTWQDIADANETWQALAENYENWAAVKNRI